jgi:nucleotide-binding universal stress UspA family protein
MFERIVVALDGSELAEGALPVAEELAGRLGLPLHLVRVADTTWLRFGANEAALEYATLGGALNEEETQARDYLEGVRTRLAEQSGATTTVTAEVRRGFAGRELIAVARPTDLLVMASHGRTGPARLLLGSVAEEVTRRAAAPVLLVRAPRG